MSFAACWLLALTSGIAAPRFTTSEIPLSRELEFKGYRVGDLDGRPGEDLAVNVWSRQKGREILIYLQGSGGAFPTRPDRRLAVKAGVVAFSFADVRQEPGEELLLFTRSGAFSLSTALDGYIDNARRMFLRDLLCDVPDLKDVAFLSAVRDVDGDGSVEILVPGEEGYGIVSRAASGDAADWKVRGELAVAAIDRSGEPGRATFSFEEGPRFKRRKRFSSVVLSAAEGSREERVLEVERWLPAPVFADVTGDGRVDLLFLERGPGSRLLRVFRQDAAGSFVAHWAGEVAGGGIHPVDFDGDGAVDLMTVNSSGSKKSTLRFLKSDGGEFRPSDPRHVMNFDGFGVDASVLDLDGDGAPELVVSHYDIPTTSVIRGGRLDRVLLIYRWHAERAFGQRPVFKYEESFGARQVKGIMRIGLGGNLMGRTSGDLLLLDADGSLTAKHVRADLSVEDEAFWSYLPRKLITGFDIVDLNGDRRSDLVLRHHRMLTVLVSRD